jgi:myo-inositol-1(or 4)-monophosphatase
MVVLEQMTAAVVAIAKEAGSFLREQRKIFRSEEVVEKGSHDYVSYVDKETEIQIISRLAELLPQAGFITEEGQGEYHRETYCWIIDPLDGTTNYIHDYAPYCVSIALREGSELVLGVVYEVCRDECFYAWKDGGAYLNGQKIVTSGVTEIEKSFVGLGLPYCYQKYMPVIQTLVPQLYAGTNGVRISGSAAANLCYIAAGRYDFWFEAYIKLWDFAAGALLVKEAGGVVTGFNGNPDFSASHHVIASANPILHTKVLNLLGNKDIFQDY